MSTEKNGKTDALPLQSHMQVSSKSRLAEYFVLYPPLLQFMCIHLLREIVECHNFYSLSHFSLYVPLLSSLSSNQETLYF